MSKITKRVGLIFGSFNPIHNGHLKLAEVCIQNDLVDEVRFVVAAQNPFKDKYELSFDERYYLVQVATYDHPLKDKLGIYAIENALHDKSTYNVLRELKIINSQRIDNINEDYFIICGDDMYFDIPRWKNGDKLLDENKFIIFNRIQTKYLSNSNVVAQIPDIMDISSHEIRDMIKADKDIAEYVPTYVKMLIQEKKYYI